MDLPPAPTPPLNSSGRPSNPADLLNLLKFSSSSSQQQPQQQQQQLNPQHQHQQQIDPQHQHPQSHGHHQHQQSPPHQDQPQHHDNQQPHHAHHARRPSFGHGQYPAGADPTGLLAALMKGAHESDEPRQAPQFSAAHRQPSNSFAPGSPSSDTRAYLLNLLNRPKPSQGEQSVMTETSRSNDTPQSHDDASDSTRYFAQYQQPSKSYAAQPYRPYPGQPESFGQAQNPPSNVGGSLSSPQAQDDAADVSALYHHVFGNMQQASPQNQAADASSGAASLRALKKDHPSPASSHSRDQPRPAPERSPLASPPDHGRRPADRSSSLHSHRSVQQYPKVPPQTSEFESFNSASNNKSSVSDAFGGLPNNEDRENLDRDSGHDTQQPAIPEASDARWSGGPQKGRAWPEGPEATAWTDDEHTKPEASKEFDEEPAHGPSVSSHNPQGHEAAPVSADTAQAVVDSWESADQEEIVVIEEKEHAPIRVFNFPLKPWISIALQENGTDPRPLLRDESIMDIARLKRDFDQIDRNLYTASQTYMTYGMSKQGGLRVIRQDDGKDAKVFTDTKDRIFHVVMSVAPHDGGGVHREAIIGTGVSGTVYWVQINEGEKDHIEDAHLEQYGFALPPMATEDGDASVGLLKTRARASTAHPEFFAVGRGKTIHFIWPSYIMHNKLFKTGHDRVVDTEKLSKQCSLKINTGKTGTDFTFSQDDTVVVSLDKAGRVKFWDVRDLMAPKEGSENRAPMPAQTSLEIKEPLLSLSSAPEGEKAWPSSVMLLDKQRPFQRRCALRYMIVGMKQNHTLQLWDLALGKPVQEFNLPHSSESDAMCSIMYHPASGMIVVGHPTRNSIFFAHLSAPKYTLKGVSQAEYIQRLVAQDSSIPQPDSTAVISGVREYSFANRGVIRSLDILCSPAMVQDTDEPPLFELYAMHSKGVACLLIKQYDLGWSRDNKVLDAVDAVVEGVVAVSKLKSPQLADGPGAGDQAQARIAHRGAAKEPTSLSTLAQSESAESWLQFLEAATPVKPKTEIREMETPAQSSKEGQAEKPERRPRKKKGASGKESEPAANGTSNPPRAGPSGSKTEPSRVTGAAAPNGMPSEMLDAALAGMEARLTVSVSETLKSSLENLQGKIDEGARLRDTNFNQQQVNLLNMVSEVLNENTQKVLESLIHHQFTQLVVPTIGDHAAKAVKDLLQHKLQPSIASSVQKELQSTLPYALNRALCSADFVNAISDRLGSTIASSVQQDIVATLTQSLSSNLSSMTNQSVQRVVNELHQQNQERLEHVKAQRATDASKIDQLLTQVSQLTDMVSSLAASQSSLQSELMKLSQQPVHELPGASGVPGSHSGSGAPYGMNPPGYGSSLMAGSNPPSHHGSFAPSQGPLGSVQSYVNSPGYMRGSQPAASSHGPAGPSDHAGPVGVGSLAGPYAASMSKDEADANHELMKRIQRIEKAIDEGRLQEAVVQWIQSGYEKEIFRRSLGAYQPSRFDGLPPIMLLVIIATISKDLKPNQLLKQEIDWIEMAVRAFGDSLPGCVSCSLPLSLGTRASRLCEDDGIMKQDWDGQGMGEVLRSASETMKLLVKRLAPLLASYRNGYPLDPFLAKVDKGKMEWIVRSSEHMLESFGGAHRYD